MVMTVFTLFFYHRYGMSEKQTGLIYTMFGVIAIVVEGVFFGILSRQLGNRLLTILGALLLMVSFFLIPLTSRMSMTIALCVMIGLGDSLITPSLATLLSCSVDEQWQGSAFGCYQSLGSLARFFGPVLAGFLLEVPSLSFAPTHDAQLLFWVASGFLFLAFLFSIQLPQTLDHAPAERKLT